MSFISEDEFRSKLENSSNLINILESSDNTSEDSKDLNKDKIKEIDETIEHIVDNGIKLNHDGKTRHTGQAGKLKGDVNIPQVLRNIIGIQANFDSTSNVAKRYGISQPQASNLARGLVSPTLSLEHPPNAETSKAVFSVIDRVNEKVIARIETVLDNITESKLEGREAKELSQIASNLSRVMTVTQPKKDDRDSGTKVQVVFMNPAPSMAPDFKTIEIGG